MIDEEVCEECNLYGTTGTDHCEADCVRVAIKALEQEPKWIPVGEKLPKSAFGCLVTVEEDDRCGEPQRVLYPEFVGYDGETWNNADGNPIPFEVIAWMPLLKPYEPQESEDNNTSCQG